MDDQERYLQFMENETALANQERISFSNIEQVQGLMEMMNNKNLPTEIESYINKNISILFNYAPHLTIQVFIALFAASNQQYMIIDKLSALLMKPDLPAKAYGVINSYISILKDKETATPSTSFASDDKIKEAIDDISPQKMSRIVFSLQVRLQTGEKMDHFVDLLNPFMAAPSKDPIYKLSLLQQLAALAKKFPATQPFHILINDINYDVILDNSFDDQTDPFLRAVNYYSKSLNLTTNLDNLMSSFSAMYRILHYNEKYVLNTEADVKSFCCCLVEAYNENVKTFAPQSVFYLPFPDSYKDQKGYKEASKFLNVVFRPRYL
ncbi:MAG: hypothetical protein LKJ88_08250 [Bacilli bacterium]|jgi:hypothetical protein|nr:hypothetical protein [Bacilli bacterium]